ncbi:DUF6850 family outer membrane beta-barrel protein [Flavobacterium reichenbachii]|uniref:DUF6850 domain-containing protein n=1 Tax=Flavobacterium reichenbachii TaxID=362418 RepID=A0A085ZJY2_9FLAO|nr:DUF6850 family outer membrane beta-barrel protein [Flavobacterium reichenbachii]KFF04746.1 hypothetical protein IW19_04005 [Flavobacterium reichenbachii]OXB10355.1 hypothetical protein B0A68_22450 [Flavobacterium reichenbachii]
MKIKMPALFKTKSNIRKYWILLVLFIFNLFSARAQDSIIITNHSIDAQLKNQIFKYPVNYTKQHIKDFTFTEIIYEYQKNEFARKQIANEINSYQFSAQGYYTTKSKWNLFGNLSIKKTDEKDLGWVLSDDRSEEQEVILPHYFYVPRKANWTNQEYKVSGGISKNITNKISIAAKLNYNTGKYSRNLDPRPEIISRKLGGELQLGYQLQENHNVFALADYSRSDKDFSYKYKDTHSNVEGNPETYLRFNSGYGRILNYFKSDYGSNKFLYKEIQNKIGIGYNFSTKNITLTALYYNQKSDNNFYTSIFGTEDKERLTLETTLNHAEIFALYKWNKREIKSTLKFDKSNARNYDLKNNGYNYKNSLNAISWLSSVSQKTGSKIDYLFGLDILYQQNQYSDIMATNDIEINSLNTGIFGSKDFSFGKSKLNSTVSFNMYFPLPSKLEYYDTSGGTNASFLNEVIIYDYAVSTTNYFAPALRLEYSYPVKNNKTVVFFTNLKEKIALKKQTDYPVNINTNTTYWVQMGVQLNY